MRARWGGRQLKLGLQHKIQRPKHRCARCHKHTDVLAIRPVTIPTLLAHQAAPSNAAHVRVEAGALPATLQLGLAALPDFQVVGVAWHRLIVWPKTPLGTAAHGASVAARQAGKRGGLIVYVATVEADHGLLGLGGSTSPTKQCLHDWCTTCRSLDVLWHDCCSSIFDRLVLHHTTLP